MSSDSEAIRNLGYIAWKNDLSWMERQQGPAWDALVRDENMRFKRTLKGLGPLVKKMESELNSTKVTSSDEPYSLNGWQIESIPFSPEKQWTHSKSGFTCKCWDADISDELFVAAVQVPGGFERFTVELYSMSGKKPVHLKTIERAGPGVALLDGSVVYLESENDLRYSSVNIWTNNKDIVRLFHSKDLKENLEIERGEDGSVYIVRGDFTKKYYALVTLPNKLLWKSSPHRESCIVSDSLKLDGIKDTIESFSLKANWTVTISRGIRTLWKDKEPVVWIWGDVAHDSRNPFRLDISDIRYDPYTIILPEWKLSNPKPVPFPCSYYDNPLPVFVVHPKQSVKGLLITAYGAYGTPTHAGSLIKYWKPLLLRGWILASVMVPGSGDDTKEWIQEGQRLNRLHAIDLLTKSIKSLQEEFGISPQSTALYGRSAGGLLAASVSVRTPGLVGSLYMESPYLDILRTISNPALPLTTLETSEYGTSPINVIATAAWSPMEHIPKEGLPGLVIVRTDLTDLQVLAYEPLKFIQRARGSDLSEKLIYVHKGRGHFTTTLKTRAEDLALLESSGARIKNIGYKYKMVMSRKNRNMTRKNRNMSRKNRNRKNRNATMGGRRRRSGSRGRKH